MYDPGFTWDILNFVLINYLGLNANGKKTECMILNFVFQRKTLIIYFFILYPQMKAGVISSRCVVKYLRCPCIGKYGKIWEICLFFLFVY